MRELWNPVALRVSTASDELASAISRFPELLLVFKEKGKWLCDTVNLHASYFRHCQCYVNDAKLSKAGIEPFPCTVIDNLLSLDGRKSFLKYLRYITLNT